MDIKILDLIKYYKLLQEDYNLLRTVYSAILRSVSETSDAEELLYRNHQYCQKLLSLVQDNFPATATDVASWSEMEWREWLDLLIKNPIFWQGKEEILIGLFWSLDGKGLLKDTENVVSLCTHLEMVDYAADSRHEAAVKTLNALIDKYATLNQAEIFQNRVDLKINDIR